MERDHNVDGTEEVSAGTTSDINATSRTSSDTAVNATSFDEDNENDERNFIVIPNMDGDPIIIPIKSKQKPEHSKAEPTQVSDADDSVVDKVDDALLDKYAITVEEPVDAYHQSFTHNDISNTTISTGELLLNGTEGVIINSTINATNNNNFEVDDGPRQVKRVDYASNKAGAQILEQSPSLKGASNLLTGDKDKYSIAPCMDKKYIVIGLSEDILVKQIILANYERYSSRVKEFQVLASQEYPTPNEDYWNSIGTYEAHSKSGEQAFELLEPTWARYLKFRFVSHYGSEHYCTLSQIKVHGSTMLQGFHEQWTESEKKDLESESLMESEQEEGGIISDGGGKVTNENSIEDEGVRRDLEEIVNEDIVGDGEIAIADDNVGFDVTLDSTDNGEQDIDSPVMNGIASTVLKEGVAHMIDNRQQQDISSVNKMDEFESSIVRESQEGGEPPLTTSLTADGEDIETEEFNSGDINLANDVLLTVDNMEPKPQESTSDVQDPTDLVHPNDLNETNDGGSTSAVETVDEETVVLEDADPIHVSSINSIHDAVQNARDALRTIEVLKSMVDASDVIKNATRETIKTAKEVLLIAAPTKTSNSEEEISSNATLSVGSGYRGGEVRGSENEIAHDNLNPKAVADVKNDTSPEKVISVSEGQGQKEHDIKRRKGSDGKDSRVIEETLSELYEQLSRHFPHASCLQELEFQAFKSKTLPVQPGNGGLVGGGAKMEPIFSKITSEIKSVQVTQHQYEQYISAVKSCYQSMFFDMVKDLDSMQSNFDQRLSVIEQTNLMRINGHLVKLSTFSSAFATMAYQTVHKGTWQDAISLACCVLLIWRFFRRNVRGPKTLDYSVGTVNKVDRDRIANCNNQIPDLIAEKDLPDKEVILFAQNMLLKNELVEVKRKLANAEEKLRYVQIFVIFLLFGMIWWQQQTI